VTEPFFCDMPVMSSTEAPLPSMCAAMPISAPTVITPVPPMPLIRMLYGCSQSGRLAQAVHPAVIALRGAGLVFQRAAFHRDEARAEALHARVVLVARRLVDGALAADSVSFGRMDTQLDWMPQSPQPSHGFVDDHALGGSGNSPFAAAAFFGGAGLVVDQHRHAGTSRSSRCTASMSLRSCSETMAAAPNGRSARQVFRHQRDALHAFGGHLLRDHRHRGGPSTGWPPVMATASLYRIL
jgi:hypothetical protein